MLGLSNVHVRLGGMAQGKSATDPVMVLAYLDDVVIGVPPELAERALSVAQEELGRVGLSLNVDKTEVWSKSGTPPDSLRRYWRPDGFVILGSPVDSDPHEAVGDL